MWKNPCVCCGFALFPLGAPFASLGPSRGGVALSPSCPGFGAALGWASVCAVLWGLPCLSLSLRPRSRGLRPLLLLLRCLRSVLLLVCSRCRRRWRPCLRCRGLRLCRWCRWLGRLSGSRCPARTVVFVSCVGPRSLAIVALVLPHALGRSSLPTRVLVGHSASLRVVLTALAWRGLLTVGLLPWSAARLVVLPSGRAFLYDLRVIQERLIHLRWNVSKGGHHG